MRNDSWAHVFVMICDLKICDMISYSCGLNAFTSKAEKESSVPVFYQRKDVTPDDFMQIAV